jgi:hypothetical protein|tara:strand:- start:60 stop:536 length:477 start_codon:yes stop_codon:yes gene_type:complete
MSFTGDKDSDNYMTSKQDWERISEFIPQDKVIWAPFYGDGKQKEYFEEMGYNIIHNDEDFFENNHGEIIIDNPPFSKKKEVMIRLKELDKPFIIICPSLMIGYKYFLELFANQIQIIVPYKRISFKHIDTTDDKPYTPPFGSFYYCYKMNLPKDLLFI